MTQTQEHHIELQPILTYVGGLIRNFARTYQLDEEDLYQEAALALLLARPSTRPDASRSFFFVVVRNHLSRLVRRRTQAEIISLDRPVAEADGFTVGDLLLDEADSPEDEFLRRELFAQVHDAVQQLPLDEQYAVIRRFALCCDLNPCVGIPPRGRSARRVSDSAAIHLRTALQASTCF